MAKAIHANVKIALTAVNAAEHKYPHVQPDGRQKIAVFSEKPIVKGENVMLPDLADNDATRISVPDFPVPFSDAYKWRRSLCAATPEGTYEWTMPECKSATKWDPTRI